MRRRLNAQPPDDLGAQGARLLLVMACRAPQCLARAQSNSEREGPVLGTFAIDVDRLDVAALDGVDGRPAAPCDPLDQNLAMPDHPERAGEPMRIAIERKSGDQAERQGQSQREVPFAQPECNKNWQRAQGGQERNGEAEKTA